MANEQNLIPNEQRTPRERRENAKKAGRASAKKRAERKAFKELFDSYLEKGISNEQLKEKMKQFGFTDKECTNKNAIIFGQFGEALKGSTQAFIAIRDTIGEKPIEQIQNLNPPVINIERPKKDG